MRKCTICLVKIVQNHVKIGPFSYSYTWATNKGNNNIDLSLENGEIGLYVYSNNLCYPIKFFVDISIFWRKMILMILSRRCHSVQLTSWWCHTAKNFVPNFFSSKLNLQLMFHEKWVIGTSFIEKSSKTALTHFVNVLSKSSQLSTFCTAIVIFSTLYFFPKWLKQHFTTFGTTSWRCVY